MKTSDYVLIVASISLAVYWVLIALFPSITSPVVQIYNWILDTSLIIGYPGTFVVSFIGNATVLFPFPYFGVPFVLGGLLVPDATAFAFDPWIVGLLSGVGAAIGEMTGYAIGYGGGQLIDEEKRNGFKEYALSHPRALPFVIWFLAATPIPDDVLVVPLGAARYAWWKVFVPQLFGKTMFLSAIAWAGRFGLQWIDALLLGDPTSLISRSIEVIAIFLVVLSIYMIIKVDWARMGTATSS
ncbi:MAG: VTT domain-containing protein [Candidatus Thorarchaeota archaeon]|jgi:membrane protein YqaA with SNARE-associated domain